MNSNGDDIVMALSGQQLDNVEVEFKQFMAELYKGGKMPYQWQLRLLRAIAADGRWPQVLDVPTGSGKTTVIEIHIFLNGLAGLGEISSKLPRRLILTVNRRALVDNQFEVAESCRKKMRTLASDNPSGQVARIWNGLIQRVGKPGIDSEFDEKPLDVICLRGGEQTDAVRNDWRMRPSTPMIICATPDMFGSRLLFRGYGVSKFARPLEAGLFAYDAVAVVDEAHLNRQLEKTARRVADIESMAAEPIGISPLQVMIATATPVDRGGDSSHISLNEEDLLADPVLTERVQRPKPLSMISIKGNLIATAVEECAMLFESDEPWSGVKPIGCIMNTVDGAVSVAEQLEKMYGKEHVVCVMGRMRSIDRTKAMEGIEKPATQFIVGTQALEVGLDIDFSALVTQLASGSAIAQRSGRVNRFAERETGPIHVLIPDDLEKGSGPYRPEELEAAKTWLAYVKDNHEEGLTPWLLASDECRPPDAERKRTIYERLEWADVDYFSNTSRDLAPETDAIGPEASNLDLWLRDEFSDDAEVYVIVRRMHETYANGSIGKAYDDGAIRRVLELVPPLPAEQFPVSIGTAASALRGWYGNENKDSASSNCYLIRNEEAPTAWNLSSIHPGDIFVVDETAKLFLRDVVRYGGKNLGSKDDVYTSIANNLAFYTMGAPIVITVENHVDNMPEAASSIEQLDNIANALVFPEDDDGDTSEDDDAPTRLFKEWVDDDKYCPDDISHIRCPTYERIREIVGGDGCNGSLDCVLYGETPIEGYALIYTPRDNSGFEFFHGTTTDSSEPVKLENHLNDVASRACCMGEALDLPQNLVDALEDAGRLHDEGKRDRRFQTLLRLGDRKAQDLPEDLAKGRFASRKRALDYRKTCGLRGWRHEQRSAVAAWVQLDGKDDRRELATRLVGTSHGHGRALFDDDEANLLPKEQEVDESFREAARYLFDYGAWEQIVDRTNRKYGTWGIAYLEAMVRAADMQVSSEGR